MATVNRTLVVKIEDQPEVGYCRSTVEAPDSPDGKLEPKYLIEVVQMLYRDIPPIMLRANGMPLKL